MTSIIGDPTETVNYAIHLLHENVGLIRSASRLYRTPAFPPGTGPDYINAAAVLDTALSAGEVLDKLHEIEAELGRERRQRWGRRTLDLDLLAMDDLVLPDVETFTAWASLPLERQMRDAPRELILPHPRLHERAFVLVPLAEVAPDWRHPVLGLSVTQMLALLGPALIAEVSALE